MKEPAPAWPLVAVGAIPGALLRWGLERGGVALKGPVMGLWIGDLVANLLACAVLGGVLALPSGRRGWRVAGGAGFCGSLSTFSSWIGQLHAAWQLGQAANAAGLLTVSLLGGLAVLALSRRLLHGWFRRRR
ncbi:MAG: CrcB family protein [Cyanobacteriota bacterium]|jgi:CrcB protein|nr:CrcB family protein [Cyanobacteriota bacterium]